MSDNDDVCAPVWRTVPRVQAPVLAPYDLVELAAAIERWHPAVSHGNALSMAEQLSRIHGTRTTEICDILGVAPSHPVGAAAFLESMTEDRWRLRWPLVDVTWVDLARRGPFVHLASAVAYRGCVVRVTHTRGERRESWVDVEPFDLEPDGNCTIAIAAPGHAAEAYEQVLVVLISPQAAPLELRGSRTVFPPLPLIRPGSTTLAQARRDVLVRYPDLGRAWIHELLLHRRSGRLTVVAPETRIGAVRTDRAMRRV